MKGTIRGNRDDAVVGALSSHQCGPGLDSLTRCHMWVEFVVGSRPCSERFFSGYSHFPLSSKTNISKFQFNLESVLIEATYQLVSWQSFFAMSSSLLPFVN